MVPVTKTVPCTYTVMVPHVQKRMETYCVAVPVTRQVTETYQVQVPTYQDGGKQVHGVRSGLDRPDGAMYGDGAGLRNPPGHAMRDALRAGQGDVHALRR